ncbi:DoxX family protein [Halpernia frigidisoli]|uniref:DoxX-like family protein n=1 Tax=Halpernia frigidisoli TaxID=1125876 RepID=A0A1I3HGQ6_9FLAO|nr:DoxX family protein [Halpernia frigidisoli]SFI34833.1 DoxX-like family protein [Halpernia frigidisoli]
MSNLQLIAQIIVAASVAYVWIFRYDVIIKEFRQFGLSDLTRTFVGVTKIALATLLVAGIWFSPLVAVPAILMGLLMVAAQYFHFKIKNPFFKHLPSLVLLILCAFIALASLEII